MLADEKTNCENPQQHLVREYMQRDCLPCFINSGQSLSARGIPDGNAKKLIRF